MATNTNWLVVTGQMELTCPKKLCKAISKFCILLLVNVEERRGKKKKMKSWPPKMGHCFLRYLNSFIMPSMFSSFKKTKHSYDSRYKRKRHYMCASKTATKYMSEWCCSKCVKQLYMASLKHFCKSQRFLDSDNQKSIQWYATSFAQHKSEKKLMASKYQSVYNIHFLYPTFHS